MSELSIFDKETPLPNNSLNAQEKALLGFEHRYQKVSQQLSLLMHLGELEKWSQKHFQKPTRIIEFVKSQHPLVIFYGDVGTGKSVTAECLANRMIRDDNNKEESVLYKLSTRVRGTGKVGEMGTLINQAFDKIKSAAGKKRRAFLIIDEGDSLAAQRSQEHSHHEDKVAVNTLIQRLDELQTLEGRVIVILCTNRLNAVDPAIQRRAAIVEQFSRPTEHERRELFENDLTDLDFNDTDIKQLVTVTGEHEHKRVPWTYSDVRGRLYPRALAKAFPLNKLTIEHFVQAAQELEPSPIMEDA